MIHNYQAIQPDNERKNTMDIIKLTRELAKAIQQDQVYADLQAARKLNDDDAELQQMIEQFGVKNTAYEFEANKDNPDEKKLEKLEGELEAMYEKVMSNANMLRFEGAKAKMDELMNKIMALLAAAVNGEDPDTIDPDELLRSECEGDCDCCGHHCHDDDCDCDDCND